MTSYTADHEVMEISFLEKKRSTIASEERVTYLPTNRNFFPTILRSTLSSTTGVPCSGKGIYIYIYLYIKWRRQDTPTNLGFEPICSLSTLRIRIVAQGFRFRFIWLTTRVTIDRINIRRWHAAMYCIQIQVQTKIRVRLWTGAWNTTHTQRETGSLV